MWRPCQPPTTPPPSPATTTTSSSLAPAPAPTPPDCLAPPFMGLRVCSVTVNDVSFVLPICVFTCSQKDETEGYCSDSASASTIHLSGGPYSGMVLYFREVSR